MRLPVLIQIGHFVRDRNRRLLFHGWSRLCLHALSFNVSDKVAGVSDAAASLRDDTAAETRTKRSEEADSAVGQRTRQHAVRLVSAGFMYRN